uniref:Uncharacterized protein n=1 Tax=Arundo donax TaxID=35708 RepID=A0A0A9B679_ARUDO
MWILKPVSSRFDSWLLSPAGLACAPARTSPRGLDSI